MDPSPSPPVRSGAPGSSIAASERERVVELLTRHYAADRLTDAELQSRLDRLYAASTPVELESVLAGLPIVDGTDAEPVKEVRALLSGQEQRLTGPLPRRLKLRARFGYVELDLTGATYLPGVTDIEVDALCGYVEIRVSPGVRIENAGHAVLGYFSMKPEEGPPPGQEAPVLRISGRAVLGYMECIVPKKSFLQRLMSG